MGILPEKVIFWYNKVSLPSEGDGMKAGEEHFQNSQASVDHLILGSYKRSLTVQRLFLGLRKIAGKSECWLHSV
jgi:hypothetical protein